jgi:transposase
MEALEGRAM